MAKENEGFSHESVALLEDVQRLQVLQERSLMPAVASTPQVGFVYVASQASGFDLLNCSTLWMPVGFPCEKQPWAPSGNNAQLQNDVSEVGDRAVRFCKATHAPWRHLPGSLSL